MRQDEVAMAQVVAEDLAYLCEEWDQEISDASLRRSSAVLRRLLVDNEFGRAWRALGFEEQPVVSAMDLEKVLQGSSYNDVIFAHAGGATYHGMEVFGAVLHNRALSPAEIRERAKFRLAIEAQPLSLRKFVEAPILVVTGSRISRRELILYVANKCGGTHFDARRRTEKPLEEKFVLLDRVRAGRIQIIGKEAVYLSLLSVGQNLAEAEDTERYITRWRDVCPRHR